MDTIRFGAMVVNCEEGILLRLKNELDVVYAFAAFIVFAPRVLERIRPNNSVYYAEQVIPSVRGHYSCIHVRRPGFGNGSLG